MLHFGMEYTTEQNMNKKKTTKKTMKPKAAEKVKTSKKSEKKICPTCYCNLKKNCISCPGCEQEICLDCVKMFLLQNEKKDAECPLCKHAWNDEFVRTNTPKNFHNKEFRDYKAKVDLSIEKSLFPAAMVHVQREKLLRKTRERVAEMKAERLALKRRIRELNFEIQFTEQSLARGEVPEGGAAESKGDDPEESVNFYTRPCPVGDCKGSLNSRGKCGLCEIVTCLKCENRKNEGHECNKDDVASVKEKMKGTVPCPTCHSRIFKTAGCDHMWCTKPGCETSFDWKSGKKIANSKNTNPHYYAFRAANGGMPRDPLDVPCGGLPPVRNTMVVFQKYCRDVDGSEVQRSVAHNQNIMLPQYTPPAVTENIGLTVKFLMNEISEQKYEKELRARHKKREKLNSVHPLLEMYNQTLSEMIIRISAVRTQRDFDTVFSEMTSLQEYTNKELEKLGREFDNVMPVVRNFYIMTKEPDQRRRSTRIRRRA
jgi:hypothetical protein